MKFKIRIEAEALNHEIYRLSRMAYFKVALQSAAVELAGEMKRYPPQSRRPQPFKTRKQQRAFFAKLKSGAIEVPYERGMNKKSQKLGQSWTTQTSDNGLRVTVGTAVRYARVVMDSKQSNYHKVTGWKTAKDIARDFRPRFIAIVTSYLRQVSR